MDTAVGERGEIVQVSSVAASVSEWTGSAIEHPLADACGYENEESVKYVCRVRHTLAATMWHHHNAIE
jgi:hypothetical protein